MIFIQRYTIHVSYINQKCQWIQFIQCGTLKIAQKCKLLFNRIDYEWEKITQKPKILLLYLMLYKLQFNIFKFNYLLIRRIQITLSN